MLVNKNLLREAVMLDSIKALIIKDTVEIAPQLLEKLKELQSELPFWIKDLEQVVESNKDVKKFDINDYVNKNIV
jgi:hypothetical protein